MTKFEVFKDICKYNLIDFIKYYLNDDYAVRLIVKSMTEE